MKKPMNDEKLNFSQWNPTTAAPFLKEKEGLRLRAYKDIGGVWTIGYGHTGGVHAGQVIDLKTANRILLDDIQNIAEELAPYVHVPVTQGQFVALISLAFNVGAPAVIRSRMLRYFNAGNMEKMRIEFLDFNRVNRVPNDTLTRRRQSELDLM